MLQGLLRAILGRRLKGAIDDDVAVHHHETKSTFLSNPDKLKARAKEMLAAGMDEREIPNRLFDEAIAELKSNPPFAANASSSLRKIQLMAGYPKGSWVQKIGFFVVNQTTTRQRRAALEFALAVEKADTHSASYAISVNNHGEVYGLAPNLPLKCVGLLPDEVMEVEKSMPPGMRRTYWLRALEIEDDRVGLIAGLLQPPVKERRDFGFEKTPNKSPLRLELTDSEVASTVGLIEWLDSKLPVSKADANKLYEAYNSKRSAAFRDVIYSEDDSAPVEERLADARKRHGIDEIVKMEQAAYGHLAQDHEIHVKKMREMKDDIQRHCQITQACIKLWFVIGMTPASHYPLRIAIILRKARRRDLEIRFLHAWIRHFPDSRPSAFTTRLTRAEKLEKRLS